MSNVDQISLMAGFQTNSSNITVVGAQWGDEGKGKIIDWCAATGVPAAVVRFNGGHNAGHTLVADQRRCVVSLVPSGVMSGTPGIIGSGVMLAPFVLVDEIERLNREGFRVSPETLRIADTVTLVLPIHAAVDQLADSQRGRIGTTGRGIGPAYEDKVGRRALRLCDLDDEEYARERLHRLVEHGNARLRRGGRPLFDAAELWLRLREAGRQLQPYTEPVAERLWRMRQGQRPVLFEGAQSVLLDIEHGTYPFVTSSSCVAGGAAAGAGVRPRDVGTVLGVAKAYLTRVGEGPFPTEDHGAAGEAMFSRGREIGTNTGRRRRCGWMDAALLRQACRAGGIDCLALTKLDVLDGLPALRIGVGYLIDGRRVDSLPSLASAQARATPVYESVEGWTASTAGVRRVEDLPAAALAYVRRIEELVEVPVVLVSTGPDRSATFGRLGSDPITVS